MSLFDSIFNPGDHQESANNYARRDYNDARADFNNTRAQTDPFYSGQVQAGTQATGRLADFLGFNGYGAQSGAFDSFQNSPGFDAQLQAGTDAIDQSAAARGMLQSGATLKDLRKYGQGLYDQGYGNHLSHLFAMKGQGQAGAQGLTNNSRISDDLYRYSGGLHLNLGKDLTGAAQSKLGNLTNLATTAFSAAAGMPTGSFGTGGKFIGS